MNTVVKTFLLVSAAYLFGGRTSTLANGDDREVTQQDRDDRIVEENADEDQSRLSLLANLSLPIERKDASS
jgi:hypothetical protein